MGLGGNARPGPVSGQDVSCTVQACRYNERQHCSLETVKIRTGRTGDLVTASAEDRVSAYACCDSFEAG